MRQPTLATRTSTATSLLFLFAILAVGMASMYSFRTQLTNVMIAEQNTLVERIADNLDQKLRALQRALLLSAIEITEADVASSDKAQEYLDSNGGLYAAFDRSIPALAQMNPWCVSAISSDPRRRTIRRLSRSTIPAMRGSAAPMISKRTTSLPASSVLNICQTIFSTISADINSVVRRRR